MCGCESCKPRLPELIKPYTWTEDGEAISCANCGFTAGADEWLTWECNDALRSDNPAFDHVVVVARAQMIAGHE